MTDFVSVLTDIHQQRQFDLPLLREFISTNPPPFVDFFFYKNNFVSLLKIEGFILARLSREGHYYYHEMS